MFNGARAMYAYSELSSGFSRCVTRRGRNFEIFSGSPGAGILVRRLTVYICFANYFVIRSRRFARERNADVIDFLGSPAVGF